MHANIFEQIADGIKDHETFVVATVVGTTGSSPAKTSFRLMVKSDGTSHGTVGGGALENEVIKKAMTIMGQESSFIESFSLESDLHMACGGNVTVLLESFSPSVLHIFGAGHVCQALIRVVQNAGFTVIVYDDREEFRYIGEKFNVKFVHGDMATSASRIKGGKNAYALVTTYDHLHDEAVGMALVDKDLGFLGIIGSSRKSVKYRNNFLQAGVAKEKVDSIICPVGLPIGGSTPGEIAVSIASQLIAVRSGKISNFK
ncbi:MAG: XdhC family protein [Deltaproteobacteria bacterium]|nr:XdhC family protein [Deltaproteobacteria bacterium]